MFGIIMKSDLPLNIYYMFGNIMRSDLHFNIILLLKLVLFLKYDYDFAH